MAPSDLDPPEREPTPAPSPPGASGPPPNQDILPFPRPADAPPADPDDCPEEKAVAPVPAPSASGKPGRVGRWGRPGSLSWRMRVAWALSRLRIERRLRIWALQFRVWFRLPPPPPPSPPADPPDRARDR
jgi:hypothetical protein